jgi:phosphatidylserine decarboxylase
MKIHREGFWFIICALLIFAIIVISSLYIFPSCPIVCYILFSVCLIVFLIIVFFFRVPKRKLTISEGVVISPADGKIVAIEETMENEFFHDMRIQISVFMSPFNVHQNRYPMEGIVKYFKYHPGKHLVAFHPKSSLENERTTVVIASEENRSVLVRQIAGAMARRIVCYSKEGVNVKQCEELGFIKFGSRVDVFLPLDVKVNVKLHEKVKGGISVLAQFI